MRSYREPETRRRCSRTPWKTLGRLTEETSSVARPHEEEPGTRDNAYGGPLGKVGRRVGVRGNRIWGLIKCGREGSQFRITARKKKRRRRGWLRTGRTKGGEADLGHYQPYNCQKEQRVLQSERGPRVQSTPESRGFRVTVAKGALGGLSAYKRLNGPPVASGRPAVGGSEGEDLRPHKAEKNREKLQGSNSNTQKKATRRTL